MARVALSVVAIGLVVLLFLPAIVMTAVAGEAQPPPTQTAIDDIPAAYLALYQEATRRHCPSMPWSVLAAIGKVESDHGRLGGARLHGDGSVWPRIIGVALDGSPGVMLIRDTDGGRYDGDTVYDRAVGPMQFIPSTWAAYGVDASGNGIADPHNAIDAIHSAAVYLCDHGAGEPGRLDEAVLAYNRSSSYLEAVMRHASVYAVGGGIIEVASPTLIAMVLANPRLDIYAGGREDIAQGRIDARVLTVMQFVSERHTLGIVSLKTGHSRCIGGREFAGCRVSHHWHGRAVDIATIDGRPVSVANPVARDLVMWLHELPPHLRPDEVGNPWRELSPLPGFFSDAAHQGHLHLGWRQTSLPDDAA